MTKPVQFPFCDLVTIQDKTGVRYHVRRDLIVALVEVGNDARVIIEGSSGIPAFPNITVDQQEAARIVKALSMEGIFSASEAAIKALVKRLGLTN